jgi:small basic protein
MIDAIMNFLPLVQYPAAVFTIVGYYFVGSTHAATRKTGFILGVTSNIIWVVYGLLPIQLGIVITNVAIFVMGMRGYLNNSYNIDEKMLKYMENIGLIEKHE